MSRYVLGDVQGCLRSLERLLDRIAFDAGRDHLLFLGDLVNRGPRSLEVLRFVRGLGPAASCILGNHEVHLLGVRAGVRAPEEDDAWAELEAAPDRAALLDWMAGWPLTRREEDRWFLVHAGLLPSWSLAEAEERARRAEGLLRARPAELLAPGAAGAEDPEVAGAARDLAVLTRIRGVDAAGSMAASLSGPPEAFPPDLRPWFELPHRREPGWTVLFGHWASLLVRRMEGAVSLDSGCVWGGWLSALRLEDGALFQVEADPGEVRAWMVRPGPGGPPTCRG